MLIRYIRDGEIVYWQCGRIFAVDRTCALNS
jgi:hypothetical protein